MAAETDLRDPDSGEDQSVWVILDSIFNVVFLIELILRMYAERRNWPRDFWNIFDFLLVSIGVIDTWILPLTGLDGDIRFLTLMRLFRLLRLIRILRVLRLLRFLKELMLLVQGITSAMRAMVWGLLLLGITIFICALLVTRLVGKACCDPEDSFQDPLYRERFGTLVRTSFTLFQFTMEFQPDICRDTWESGPWLTLFFVAYTMFTNITLLNTVASVIVENILNIAKQNLDDIKAHDDAQQALINDARIARIFKLVDVDGNKMIDKDELNSGNPAVEQLLELSGVTLEHALHLFNVMDVDASGNVTREEFQQALARGTDPLKASDVLKLQCQVDAMRHTVSESLEDVAKKNTTIIKVLERLEEKQASLEDLMASAKQPDSEQLDNLCFPFGIKPTNEPTNLVAVSGFQEAEYLRAPSPSLYTQHYRESPRVRPMTAPPPSQLFQAESSSFYDQFGDQDTLLV